MDLIAQLTHKYLVGFPCRRDFTLGRLNRRSWERLTSFYGGNSFLIKAGVAILLALAYPPLGSEYVRPKVTATYIAVMFIFREFRKTRNTVSGHSSSSKYRNLK